MSLSQKTNRSKTFRGLGPVLAIALAFGIASAARAEDGWSLSLEPTYMSAFGHDQHVLSIRSATGESESIEAVTLDTEGTTAWRHELRYTRGSWTWGWDFLWSVTSQKTPVLGEAGSTETVVTYATAGREHTSADPGDTLFFRTLADTDLAMWTFDLYGMKTISSSDDDTLQVQLGVRFADFDNDYHATVGVDGQYGTLYDASSNYGRMTGPILGLAGNLRKGRHAFRGYVGQAVVLGSPDLTYVIRDYVGPFVEESEDSDAASDFVSEERFERKGLDVAIPITELRIKWTYQMFEHFAFGVGAYTSVWWDVPVPPGMIPGREQQLNENTVVLFGLTAAAEITF